MAGKVGRILTYPRGAERSADCDITMASSMGVGPACQLALSLTMCASSSNVNRDVSSGVDFVLALLRKTGVSPRSWLEFSEYSPKS